MTDVVVAFEGWNASGVGWGEQGWGQGVASLPTGTGAVGTPTVFLETLVPVTGVSATGYVGSVIIWVVIDPTQNPNWTGVGTGQNPNWTPIAA